MKIRLSTCKNLAVANQSKSLFNKKTKTKLSRFSLLFVLIFIICSINAVSQTNINNIKIWEGWKLGKVIKISGVVKFGDPLLKSDEENRYLIVQKIDDQQLDSSKTIQISYNKELFSKLENNKTITVLGYLSGGYCGIPNFNNYDLEYWQDESFHFELYFVVLKEGDGIKKKEK